MPLTPAEAGQLALRSPSSRTARAAQRDPVSEVQVQEPDRRCSLLTSEYHVVCAYTQAHACAHT